VRNKDYEKLWDDKEDDNAADDDDVGNGDYDKGDGCEDDYQKNCMKGK
jgi:hypothetical protein